MRLIEFGANWLSVSHIPIITSSLYLTVVLVRPCFRQQNFFFYIFIFCVRAQQYYTRAGWSNGCAPREWTKRKSIFTTFLSPFWCVDNHFVVVRLTSFWILILCSNMCYFLVLVCSAVCSQLHGASRITAAAGQRGGKVKVAQTNTTAANGGFNGGGGGGRLLNRTWWSRCLMLHEGWAPLDHVQRWSATMH